jgi:hypothetical protein
MRVSSWPGISSEYGNAKSEWATIAIPPIPSVTSIAIAVTVSIRATSITVIAVNATAAPPIGAVISAIRITLTSGRGDHGEGQQKYAKSSFHYLLLAEKSGVERD